MQLNLLVQQPLVNDYLLARGGGVALPHESDGDARRLGV